MAEKIIISSSTELVRLDPASIAYISSDGNYCELYLTDLSKYIFSFNLMHFREILVQQLKEEKFIRIGKSLIINKDYICYINPAKKILELYVPVRGLRIQLKASTESLKEIKKYLEK